MRKLASALTMRAFLPRAFDHTSIFVDASWVLAHHSRSIEFAQASLLRSAMLVAPGDVVWDIGAQYGFFSVAAAVRAGKNGRVFAFEPALQHVSLLRRTVSRMRDEFPRLVIAPFKIGDRLDLCASMSAPQFTLLGGPRRAEEMMVPQVNLDWLLGPLPHPRVVRIGVMGAGLEILRGQSRLLHEVRPIIICSAAPVKAHQLAGVLKTANYVLYDGDATEQGAAIVDWAAQLTIALPTERKSDLLICSLKTGP